MSPHVCTVADFYRMIREPDPSEVTKIVNIKEDLISLGKWGEVIGRRQTLVSEDPSLGLGSTTYKTKLLLTKAH